MSESKITLQFSPEIVELLAKQWQHLPANTPAAVIEQWAYISQQANAALDRHLAASELTAHNLFRILSTPTLRKKLIKALRKEDGVYLPLNNCYADLAPRCQATPEQLRQLVQDLLEHEPRRNVELLLEDLLFHPDMPHDSLMLLCKKRLCLSALNHRPGPQLLLERLVEKYHPRIDMSEAITSLALFHYGSETGDLKQFKAFVTKHANNAMLKGNLKRRKDELPDTKRLVAQEILEEKE